MPKPGIRRPARRAIVLVMVALLALTAVATASAEVGQPKGITDEAREMHDLYLFTLALGAVVFVLVEGALIYCLIKFRKKDDTLPVQIHGSNIGGCNVSATGAPQDALLFIGNLCAKCIHSSSR